ncbi:DNA polymerase epsilon subunit C isoform X1 [Canna indica]|uniref:DNA polymerase epsilon subunit C isoform X1 n=1 Tax=Canna indica TaxID=4628 RepID=A0AAQ3JY96_9LILI|nr:DNA polymerase epsilon subunit C isoform X1 [Canna indica]
MMSVGTASFTPTFPHLVRRRMSPSPTLFLNPLHFRTRAAASPLSSRRRRGHGLPPLFASRRGRRGPQLGEEDEFDGDDRWAEEVEDEEEDDGDEAAIPFQEMSQWLRNKPAGFGEGKSYDTKLEDELWEEMERSRKAQLASANKLKNEGKKSEGETKKKQGSPPKATAEAQYGTQVRIWNLPKKKNIHRDLHRAFKGFPGLVSINPAVIGNEKTREPICKGFAFIDFSSQEAANKFVQVYLRKTLCFGKVEKQIACDVIDPCGTSNSTVLSDHGDAEFTQFESKKVGVELHKTSDVEIVSQDSQGRASDGGPISIRVIDDESEAEAISPKQKNDGSSTHFEETEDSEMIIKSFDSNDSVHPIQKQKKKTSSNKKAVKTYLVKSSKPSLPGSVARLKIKERTVLTGVFSKYSKKMASDS